MKSASPALIDLLNAGGPYYMADLYTLTLIDGSILRYADWDADIVYGGNTFDSSQELFSRSRTRTVIGTEVDTLDLSIYAAPQHMIGGLSFYQACARGSLDGAILKLERVFMDVPPHVVGGLLTFIGEFGDMVLTRTELKVTVKSDLQKLNVKMPRNLYQPGCSYTLFDVDCGVSRASVATAGSVLSGSTTTAILCSLPGASGYYDMGYLEFTSGGLSGTKRTIKSSPVGSVQLLNPLPMAPSTGDGFTIYPGCNKTQSTCQNKFGNLAHYRGMPYIPVPETAF